MTATAGTLRRVVRLLDLVAQKAGLGLPLAAHDGVEASQLMRLVAPRPKPAKVASRKRRTVKRADRTSRRAAVREAAMFRDGERCVLCPAIDLRWAPLEMHHIIGRHDERVETVAMLCSLHHEKGPDSMHAGNIKTMRRLAAWCVEHGYADAARHLARRIGKAQSIRAGSAGGGAT